MSGNPHDDLPVDEWLEPAEFARNLERLVDGLPAAEPSPSILARLLDLTRGRGPLRRFAGQVARLLDIPEAQATTYLERAADQSAYAPGFFPSLSLLHVQGGPAVAKAITGFVRLAGGIAFPEHEHLGEESVLILQGRLREGDQVFGPGAIRTMPAGSSHAFLALPGPDLVYLAVVQTGLRLGEVVLTSDDPRG